MNFNIRMGIPEMQELWLDLQEKYRSGNIKKKEEQLYKKWGKALKLLSADPGYPSLQTHEIEPLSRRYGMKVWQSYLENKTSGAMRILLQIHNSLWQKFLCSLFSALHFV